MKRSDAGEKQADGIIAQDDASTQIPVQEIAPVEVTDTESTPYETFDVGITGSVKPAQAEEAPAAEAADLPSEEPAAETADLPVEEPAPAEEPAQPLDTSMVGTTGFAQCEEYLNVRAGASVDDEAVGKIYNNGSLEILGVTADGWYEVRSGNVEGYVSADYVAIGDEAEAIASVSGYTTAQTAADGLNVRADSSSDAEIIGMVDDSHEMEVVEDQGDWVKVLIDGEMYGYVSADYVSTNTEYATGETLEEEQARLDQEWLAYLAEQEAQQAAAEAAYLASLQQNSYYETTSYTDNSTYSAPSYTASVSTSGSADELASQAASLYEAYLTAQTAADNAVNNGEGEQAIVETAAAAVSAYQTYLSAQNAADAAAAGMTVEYTGSADTTQTVTETAPAQEQTYEESYEEPAYVEETPAPAPASSTGQAIADYAVQFVGNPYVYGGASLTGGADCSGFTMAVMANFGIGLPHNAAAQSGCGTPVSMDALQPGDLLFYDGGGGIGHVSIYIGGGQVVHASNPTNGILISDIGYRTPVAARRFV